MVQWFSLNDCMDGMRARRLKCGSPLGRIIDEALDQVAYSCAALTACYMLRVGDSPIYLLCLSLINVPFYSMELKFCISRNLKIIIGEIGPVEIEIIFSFLFFMTGAYTGLDVYDRSFQELTGYTHYYLAAFKIRHAIACLVAFLLVLFIFDNLYDAIKVNPTETVKLTMPVFILLAFAQISCQLPSIQSEAALVFFLYQMVFATVILKLMLYNMAKKPFAQIHF